MSLMPMKDFLFEIGKVADECYRVLKKDKFCANMLQQAFINTQKICNLAVKKNNNIL